ncbi:hypothetical protein JCM10296v2_002871 [Rhodotorula toruloides]
MQVGRRGKSRGAHDLLGSIRFTAPQHCKRCPGRPLKYKEGCGCVHPRSKGGPAIQVGGGGVLILGATGSVASVAGPSNEHEGIVSATGTQEASSNSGEVVTAQAGVYNNAEVGTSSGSSILALLRQGAAGAPQQTSSGHVTALGAIDPALMDIQVGEAPAEMGSDVRAEQHELERVLQGDGGAIEAAAGALAAEAEPAEKRARSDTPADNVSASGEGEGGLVDASTLSKKKLKSGTAAEVRGVYLDNVATDAAVASSCEYLEETTARHRASREQVPNLQKRTGRAVILLIGAVDSNDPVDFLRPDHWYLSPACRNKEDSTVKTIADEVATSWVKGMRGVRNSKQEEKVKLVADNKRLQANLQATEAELSAIKAQLAAIQAQQGPAAPVEGAGHAQG